MRNKDRITHRKQTRMSEEAPVEIEEHPQPSKVRVGKRPVDKPIGDKWSR